MLRHVNPLRAAVAFAVLTATATAQVHAGAKAPEPAFAKWVQGEPAPVAADGAAKCTVFAFYVRPTDVAHLASDAGYLVDLQRRFGPRGAVTVAVLAEAPATPPAGWAGCRIAVDADAQTATAWLGLDEMRVIALAADGTVVFTGRPESGLVDAIERTLAGEPHAEREREVQSLRELLPQGFDDATAAVLGALNDALEHAPRDGALLGLLYLAHATKANDAAAATKIVDRAVAQLAVEPRPLAAFADLALRGDRQRAGLATALRPPLEAAAKATPDDVLVQLALLRALVQLGDGRELGRRAMRARKAALATATTALDFASILTLDANAAAHKDLATIALDRAAELGAPPRLLTAARYAVAVRCAGDKDAGKLLLDGYVKDIESRVSINNDCWYLMTELATMGRFDVFASGLAERMLEQKDAMDYFEFDTAALAMFLTGRIADAIELQETAISKGGKDNPEYVERLNRYKAAPAPAPR
jgi:hypothetical protein